MRCGPARVGADGPAWHPHEPNPLLGRDDDVAAVAGLLRTSRVTSIVGTGGLGKTRLAYAVSRQAEQRVVQLVPLAGVASDADVAGEVALGLMALASVGLGGASSPTPPRAAHPAHDHAHRAGHDLAAPAGHRRGAWDARPARRCRCLIV